ncbi:MAG: GH39 family glycosyl hydrolase [Pleomorphochaeta sp.]
MVENIDVSAKENNKEIVHFWSTCVGAGRANEGLRANWQKQLSTVVKNCGFKYIRFHGLFNKDMFIYREEENKAIYNWQYVDELFDSLLDIGIRPFVEFGFCPEDMASSSNTQFWWNGYVSPPKDYDKWGCLIKKCLIHWIERYGLDEVRQWYFEVWNEPNLFAFWASTKKLYFELYKVSALSIKEVDSLLRVGGPATSNFVPDDRFVKDMEDTSKQMTFKVNDIDKQKWEAVWLKDFIDYCCSENLPVDFISTHPYPTDFALDGHGKTRGLSREVNSTQQDLKWLRNFIDKSEYPNAEIHLTEWSSSPSPRDFAHDYLPAATFVVKSNIESLNLVDSLSYWTFTDVFEEGGAGDTIFHGGFGMINFQSIVKPTFHAYRFLNYLGDNEVSRSDGYIITRFKEDNRISALIYNYPNEVSQAVPISPYPNWNVAEKTLATGANKKLNFKLRDLSPSTKFIVETLDANHGFAFKKWKEMGMKASLTRAQIEVIKESALATKKEYYEVREDGILEINKEVEPWSLISIRQL